MAVSWPRSQARRVTPLPLVRPTTNQKPAAGHSTANRSEGDFCFQPIRGGVAHSLAQSEEGTALGFPFQPIAKPQWRKWNSLRPRRCLLKCNDDVRCFLLLLLSSLLHVLLVPVTRVLVMSHSSHHDNLYHYHFYYCLLWLYFSSSLLSSLLLLVLSSSSSQ